MKSLLGTFSIAMLALAQTGCVTGLAASLQPKDDIGYPLLELTTTDESGAPYTRVLARIEDDGVLYVSANHWWHPWYDQAIAKPNVVVTIDGEAAAYVAKPVSEEEHEHRLATATFPLWARVLTGFPPRAFLKLVPASD